MRFRSSLRDILDLLIKFSLVPIAANLAATSNRMHDMNLKINSPNQHGLNAGEQEKWAEEITVVCFAS